MARLYRIWRCNTISFAGKFKLYKSLVTSILFYDCETWTLLAHSEKKERSRLLKPSVWGNFSSSPTQSTRPTTGTASGNRQETESCMARACHTPRQPLQDLPPSEHLGGWATPWSAEEMLDGQHHLFHARTADKGLLQKRLEGDLCWIVSHVPRRPYRSKDWNEWTDKKKYLCLRGHAVTKAFEHISVLTCSFWVGVFTLYMYIYMFF